MDTQETYRCVHAMQACPNGHSHSNGGGLQSNRPRLMHVSEVERTCGPASPLRTVLDWVRSFLAAPHSQLGREGTVCPFVPTALELDTIWMAEVQASASLESISEIVTEYRNLFLETEPTRAPEAINKSFLLVFPGFRDNGAEGPALIDRVQARLKRYFVDMGLMLGEFHAKNESPGLRNPDFRPLRSPIPMLAIRHMVDSDLPFLVRESYAPEERSAFLRSYLFRLGGTLTPAQFNEALDGLVASELDVILNVASERSRAVGAAQ
jgi:hypothetical protein